MKRESILALVLILIIALSACTASGNAEAPSPTPSQSASPSPTPSQPVTYTVKTDYSGLTPYKPIEEVYTRLTEDYMPELIPSDDYGPLLPYVGEVIDSDWGSFHYYGLMTKDGMIVTDAVYAGVYPESTFYVLYQPTEMAEPEGYLHAVKRYALCALDGSWATPFNYEAIYNTNQYILLVRDASTNDIDVFSSAGTLLYNTRSIGSYAELQPYSFYDPNDEMGFTVTEDGDGYITITHGTYGEDDSISFFLEATTGNIVNTDYSNTRGFSNGFAAVEKDGLWGYIDTTFSHVIAPTFENARDFNGGKSIVKLLSGEEAVINTRGIVLLITERSLVFENGFYIAQDNNLKKATIYDVNLHEVFNSDDYDSWNTFGYYDDRGFSYVKNRNTTAFNNNAITTISGSYNVDWMSDRYLFVENSQQQEYKLLTLEGKTVATLDHPYDRISEFTNSGGHSFFVLYCYSGNYDFSGNSCLVLDDKGRVLYSGEGSAYFNDHFEYFELNAFDYFAYMDTSGKYIFKISLQDNIPD
jgi:hypothetical protein